MYYYQVFVRELDWNQDLALEVTGEVDDMAVNNL